MFILRMFCVLVLHTGKRWFIICPVEETPTSSQEIPSDSAATQSPGSSGATQPADSGTSRPTASRGDHSEPLFFFFLSSSAYTSIHFIFILCISYSRRRFVLHNVRREWRLHLRCVWILQPSDNAQCRPAASRCSVAPRFCSPDPAVSVFSRVSRQLVAAQCSSGPASQSSDFSPFFSPCILAP